MNAPPPSESVQKIIIDQNLNSTLLFLFLMGNVPAGDRCYICLIFYFLSFLGIYSGVYARTLYTYCGFLEGSIDIWTYIKKLSSSSSTECGRKASNNYRPLGVVRCCFWSGMHTVVLPRTLLCHKRRHQVIIIWHQWCKSVIRLHHSIQCSWKYGTSSCRWTPGVYISYESFRKHLSQP